MNRSGESHPPRPTDPMDEGARELLIDEDEFRELLVRPVRDFLSSFRAPGANDPARWKKRAFSLLATRAHALESFLDDHDARHNKRYGFLVELVASLRGFATIGDILWHVRIRMPRYRLKLPVSDLEKLQLSMADGAVLVHQAVQHLLHAVAEEAVQLGVPVPDQAEPPQDSGEEFVRRYLPHDLEAEEANDEETVAAILSRYMELSSRLQRAENLRPKDELEALAGFVRNTYDETEARALETIVHNVQSAYDTHVKMTEIERANPGLRAFRGHVSLGLHLLEIGTLLVHFYERHESQIQHRAAKERIASLIDRKLVLHHAVFFALYHASTVLLAVRPLVSELLGRFVQQDQIELVLPEGGILHARPLSLIVSVVRHHGTAVDMVIGDQSTSANSIMGLIVFAGRHPDVRSIKFRGDRRPLEDLRLLFENGLGEDGTDHFPEEISYLRS